METKQKQKQKNIGIKRLRRGREGIAVYGENETIINVPENIIRVALGEEDMNYLLRTRADESGCFNVLESEWEDFRRYGIPL